MERALAFRSAPEHGPDVYTNLKPLWNPLWARGIYGGALIAQALAIAQHTVPGNLLAHSIHCTFIAAASSVHPLLYHVRRIPRGRNSATRLVEVRQSGKCVLIAMMGFVRNGDSTDAQKKKLLAHQVPIPLEAAPSKVPSQRREPVKESMLSPTCQSNWGSLYECVRLPVHQPGQPPEMQRLKHWIRTRDPVGDFESPETPGAIFTKKPDAHLVALAYMTDAYFIGTVSRLHHANRFNNDHAMGPLISSFKEHGSSEKKIKELASLAEEEAEETSGAQTADPSERPNVEMMVSLDHTIYFHNQMSVMADVWMLGEMETSWTGDERAVVTQRVWTQDGLLIATCFQEGAVRLLQNREPCKL